MNLFCQQHYKCNVWYNSIPRQCFTWLQFYVCTIGHSIPTSYLGSDNLRVQRSLLIMYAFDNPMKTFCVLGKLASRIMFEIESRTFKKEMNNMHKSYKNIFFIFLLGSVWFYILCVLIFNHSLKDTSRVLKIFLVDPKAWVSRVFSCKIVLSRVTFLCAIAYFRCIPIKEDLPSRNVHFLEKIQKFIYTLP